jgi:hypothetical protein
LGARYTNRVKAFNALRISENAYSRTPGSVLGGASRDICDFIVFDYLVIADSYIWISPKTQGATVWVNIHWGMFILG